MKSFTSRRFRETYANLPEPVRQQARERIVCFGGTRRTPA
jgi:hypothetical protein